MKQQDGSNDRGTANAGPVQSQIRIGQKEAYRNDEERDREKNAAALRRVSSGFRFAKYAVLLFLVVFLLGAIFVRGDALTYDNVRFLLRDIQFVIDNGGESMAERINFDADGETDYAVYAGRLAVAGESSFRLFRLSGEELLNISRTTSVPSLRTGEKYAVIFSPGGNTVQICNEVTRVYEQTYEYPVYAADVADDGSFAVLTQDREYRTVAYFMDASFRLLSTYRLTSQYGADILLSRDGSMLFISTYGTEDGEYFCQVSGYRRGSDTAVFSLKLRYGMPYDMFRTKDRLAVVFRDRICFYSFEGEEVGCFCPKSGTLLKWRASDTAIGVFTSIGDVYAIGTEDLSTLYSAGQSGVNDLLVTEDAMMLLTSHELVRVAKDGRTATLSLSPGARKLLLYGNSLTVCFSNHTESYDVSTSFIE